MREEKQDLQELLDPVGKYGIENRSEQARLLLKVIVFDLVCR